MITLDHLAIVIGYSVMAAGGIVLAGSVLFCAAYFMRKWAWRLWDEMATIYRLETMQYWFRQMKDTGRHVLRDAQLSDKEAGS
jgi:hypothetical protein